jgi:amino acid transporter
VALKRVLPLRTVVATSVGLALASSSFVAAVQVASFVAGDAAWLAILVAGVLCTLAALCFAELNGMLPSAAGLRLWLGRAFGPGVALTVSLLYMGVLTGIVGAESYVISHIMVAVLPFWSPAVWIVLMLAFVTLLNLRGVKLAGNFQDLVTYAVLCSLVVMAAAGLARGHGSLTTPLSPGSAQGFIRAVAVGIFLFVGFEWVAPLAEEVTEVRHISRGMLVAVGILGVTYALFTVAMTSLVPKGVLATSATPQVLFAGRAFGAAGVVWMAVLSLAASLKTFNAGLISVSRFMYATAREHALPSVFARLSYRYFTPWVAILTLFVVAVALSLGVLWTGRYLVLVNMAAAVESVVYALVGLSVIALRRKEPNLARPFFVPGGMIVPLVTVVVFGVLAAAVLATDRRALLYLVLGLLLAAAYVRLIVPRLRERARRARLARRRQA